MNPKERLYKYWDILYPETDYEKLDAFLVKHKPQKVQREKTDWYKDAVVYSLYVDLFNKDFYGLIEKLDYLQNLGVSCLWLLPVLDSPMRDAGFDIRNYDRIRADLLGLDDNFEKDKQEEIFGNFLNEAHQRGIKVIFDIAINHCSDEHPYFKEARKSENNFYRDYFIWTKDTALYKEARLLFKGIENSNWEPNGDGWYYFHRFFSFQPDWNYKNPDVLLEMSANMLYWQNIGIDGFRADAIPYLWKEEGTNCENLPKTHIVVKFFRAILDYVKPGTLLLAEACQKPKEVVKYLGNGDECHAAYHFPLMPMMFKSIVAQNRQPIINTLSPEVTPEIPADAQWFTFLRVHDELSLELVYVSEEDRKFIYENYCHRPDWDFRVGEGISARLSELMKRNPQKIALAYSLMLTITGTPVVYYGDEFGKLNDETYYKEQIKLTGKNDTRFFVRGRIDWKWVGKELKNKDSFHYEVFETISAMLNKRQSTNVFGRGETVFVKTPQELLAYFRKTKEQKAFVVNNLSNEKQEMTLPETSDDYEILYKKGAKVCGNIIEFEPYGFIWLINN